MTSFDQVDRLTVLEYEMLLKAKRLRDVDRDLYIHELAYLDQAAGAMKGDKHPRPVYKTFRSFFNYDRALKRAMEADKPKESAYPALSKMIQREGG